MAPDSNAVTVEFDVPAPMRDGTILRANIYRPPGRGPWPVLLTRMPYGKDFAAGYSQLDPVQTARQGYLVVVQDTRGTNVSDGDWYPFRSEAADGVDTIAWAAALPGSDGQVGMYGGSYVGFTQWAAATGQPPALKAIIPAVTWADPLNGLCYRGGALELGVMASWHLGMGLGVLLRRHGQDRATLDAAVRAWAAEVDALATTGYAALPLAEFAPLRRQAVAPAFFDTVAAPMDRTQEPNASVTIRGMHDQLQVPSLNIGGWYDIFVADTIAHFQHMHAQGVPTKLLIGPWSHASQRNPVGERSFGFAAQAGLINLQQDLGTWQRRWFDHWLKDIDTGMLAEAPMTLFVMGTNVWRDEHEWPLARAVPTRWYLHADGALEP